MGKLGIFDEEKNKWIQFDEDTEILIKLITKEGLRRIIQKSNKRAKLTGEDTADISDIMLGRDAVLGWRKINDHDHPGLIVNGQPLPFIPENIDMLMKKSLAFSRFVNEYAMDEVTFLKEEEEIKNA